MALVSPVHGDGERSLSRSSKRGPDDLRGHDVEVGLRPGKKAISPMADRMGSPSLHGLGGGPLVGHEVGLRGRQGAVPEPELDDALDIIGLV